MLVVLSHGWGKDACAVMKVISAGAFFLCLLNAQAFAQSTSFQQIGPATYEHVNRSIPRISFLLGMFAYEQPTVNAATSQAHAPLIGQIFKDGRSSASLRLWPSAYRSYGTPAGFLIPAPFAYKSFDHGTRCFSGALKPLQVVSCIALPGFDRPALTRVENIAAHVMRHYDWQGGVGVNRTCVRSLSCSSIYEKSVLQRMAVRSPN